MIDSITLTGTTDYNPRFAPSNAKKGYVAKITGRAKGAVKYEREFFGESVTLMAGDDGLYERQIGEKKGGYTRYYIVVLTHPEHGVTKSTDCEEHLAKIVKLLDDGHAIGDIIDVQNLRPSERTEGLMLFDAAVRTPGEAKKAAKSATLDSAIDSCWQSLSLLPQPEQRKVLAELRKRVNPPKPEATTEIESEQN